MQGGDSTQGVKPSILMMLVPALSAVTLFVNAAVCFNLRFRVRKSSSLPWRGCGHGCFVMLTSREHQSLVSRVSTQGSLWICPTV